MSAVLLMSTSRVETKLFENDSRVNIFRACDVVKTQHEDLMNWTGHPSSRLSLPVKTAEKNKKSRICRSQQRMTHNRYHSPQYLFYLNV